VLPYRDALFVSGVFHKAFVAVTGPLRLSARALQRLQSAVFGLFVCGTVH